MNINRLHRIAQQTPPTSDPENGQTNICDLNHELLVDVFKRLGVTPSSAFSRTCRAWRAIALENPWKTYTPHIELEGNFRDAMINPAGNSMIALTAEGMKIYAVNTGKEKALGEWRPPGGGKISPAGDCMVSIDANSKIKLFNFATGAITHTKRSYYNRNYIRFSPSGDKAAFARTKIVDYGHKKFIIDIYSIIKSTKLKFFSREIFSANLAPYFDPHIHDFALGARSQIVISLYCRGAGLMRAYEFTGVTQVRHSQTKAWCRSLTGATRGGRTTTYYTRSVRHLQFLPVSDQLIGFHSSGDVWIFSSDYMQTKHFKIDAQEWKAVAFSRLGQSVLVAGLDWVRLYDIKQWNVLSEFNYKNVTRVAFTPDEDYVMLASADKIRVLKLSSNGVV